MTLVLPALCCSRNSATNPSLFATPSPATITGRNSAMPCGFDSEPVDFESALLSAASFVPDWPSLRDLTESTEDDNTEKVTAGNTSGESDEQKCSVLEESSTTVKRKLPVSDSIVEEPADDEEGGGTDAAKRPKMDSEESSTLGESLEVSDYGSTSKCSSSRDTKDSDPSEDPSIDDLLYLPRRRVAQLWSPRLRWKDERRKVLKMSLNKLRRIEDHELYLLRSVLINNTVKRLQKEIREERSAKYHPPAHDALAATVARDVEGERNGRRSRDDAKTSLWSPSSSSSWTPLTSSESGTPVVTKAESSSSPPVEDENSCDEIFGINEDFLRITIPQRRSISPALPPPSPEAGLRCEENLASASSSSDCSHHFPAMPAPVALRLNADLATCGTCQFGVEANAAQHDTSRKASESRTTSCVHRACSRTKKEWLYQKTC